MMLNNRRIRTNFLIDQPRPAAPANSPIGEFFPTNLTKTRCTRPSAVPFGQTLLLPTSMALYFYVVLRPRRPKATLDTKD
jgi:hypothetical protein